MITVLAQCVMSMELRWIFYGKIFEYFKGVIGEINDGLLFVDSFNEISSCSELSDTERLTNLMAFNLSMSWSLGEFQNVLSLISCHQKLFENLDLIGLGSLGSDHLIQAICAMIISPLIHPNLFFLGCKSLLTWLLALLICANNNQWLHNLPFIDNLTYSMFK